MRRALFAVTGTVTAVVLLLSAKAQTGSTATGVAAASPATTGTANGATRTVTGQAIDTRYGRVQVKVTLAGTRITTVTVLQAPDDNGHSRAIAAEAIPVLTHEALAAQSANIDAVSGATYTSEGYIRSLQSALDSAHA